MDNLAKDAFLARQNRMSYGQYMAKFKPAVPKASVKRKCLNCGRWFKPTKVKLRFCNNDCGQQYRQAVEHGYIKDGDQR